MQKYLLEETYKQLPKCLKSLGPHGLGGAVFYRFSDHRDKTLAEEISGGNINLEDAVTKMNTSYKQSDVPFITNRIDHGDEDVTVKDMIDPILKAIESTPTHHEDEYIPGQILTVEDWYRLWDETHEARMGVKVCHTYTQHVLCVFDTGASTLLLIGYRSREQSSFERTSTRIYLVQFGQANDSENPQSDRRRQSQRHA